MSIKNILSRFKTLLVGNDGILIIDSEDNNKSKQIKYSDFLSKISTELTNENFIFINSIFDFPIPVLTVYTLL